MGNLTNEAMVLMEIFCMRSNHEIRDPLTESFPKKLLGSTRIRIGKKPVNHRTDVGDDPIPQQICRARLGLGHSLLGSCGYGEAEPRLGILTGQKRNRAPGTDLYVIGMGAQTSHVSRRSIESESNHGPPFFQSAQGAGPEL